MALAPPRHPVPPPSTSSSRTETKVLLVDAVGRGAVDQHPEVRPYLTNGYEIRRVTPRLVEDDGAQLLVVLTGEEEGEQSFSSDEDARDRALRPPART